MLNFAQAVFIVLLAFASGAAIGWFVRDRSPEKSASWPTKRRSRAGRVRQSSKVHTDSSSSSISLAAAGAAAAAKMERKDSFASDCDSPVIARAEGKSDDLTQIKGIGPKLNERCQALGIRRFDQIAGWSEADIAEVDRRLDFKGRVVRDSWVEQARALAAESQAIP